MTDELPGLQSKVTIDPAGVGKSLDTAIEKIHKFSNDADRSFNAFTKRVNTAFSQITGGNATDRLKVLEQAIAKAGGAGNIAAPNLERLRKEITALAAAGGKVPSALAGLQQVEAQTSKLQAAGASLAQGGGISGALGSIGPAGIAAAAGIGVLVGAFAQLGKAITDAVGDLVEKTSKLSDLNAQTNINVESLQKLGFAGEQVGVSMEEIAKGAAIMARNLVDAPQKFASLGLSATELRKLKPEEQLAEIGTAIKGITDPTLQAHAAMQIFGKGGAALLPLLKTDIAAAGDEAERLGFVLSEDVVAAGDKLGDNIHALERTWEGLKDQLAAVIVQNPELLQGIQDTATLLGGAATAVVKYRDEIGNLIALIPQITAFTNAVKVLSIVTAAVSDTELPALKAGKLKVPDAGAQQEAAIARAAAKEAGESEAQMEKSLAKLEALQKKAAGAAKKAGADAAAAAKKAAEELERLVGPSIEKAQAHLEKLTVAIADTGGAFDRSKASYQAITQQLEALEKQGAKIPGVLKDIGVQAQFALLKQKDLGIIGQAVPGITPTTRKPAIIEGIDGNTVDLLGKARAEIEGAETATVDWGKTLNDVANLFTVLGISADSGLGKVLGGLAGIGSSFDKLKTGIGGLFSASGKGIKGLFTGDFLSGLTGAIGAVKQIASLFGKSEEQKVMEDVGRHMGVKISEGLAKQIAEDSKKLGDRVAGTLKNLGKIIDEAGGVKAFGTDKAIASTRDLFSALERGQLTAKDVGATFEDVFSKILPEATDKATGRVSADFKGLIALAKQFGIESKGISDFLAGQAQTAGSSLAEGIKGGVSTEGGAAGFGAAIAAQFDELVKRGATQAEALKQLAPSIAALREELEKTGFSGGAAFDAIAGRAAILEDKVTGPLISKVDAIGTSLVALDNQGLLTQGIFTGLTGEVGATFEELKKQGVEGPEAMALMQPSLQKIWELQQQYGFAVDESTQKMLDEAVAAGAVGEAHKSAQEQMLDATQRVAVAIETLVKAMGVDLPDAAKKGAQGINDEFSKIKVPNISIPVKVGGTGDLPTGSPGAPGDAGPGFAKGGAMDFGRVKFTSLHGREAVLPAKGGEIVDELAGSLTRSIVAAGGLAQAGGGGGIGDVIANVSVMVDPSRAPRSKEEFFAEIEEHLSAGVRTATGKHYKALQDKGKIR
jgi:hypothetical protein